MNIEKILSDRNDPDRPMTDRDYLKLRTRFFWNLPQLVDENGNIQNPVHSEEQELFNRFLIEADRRNEIFNPTYAI